MATVSRGLPDRPHLDVPKREARELLELWQASSGTTAPTADVSESTAAAFERVKARHPRFKDASPAEMRTTEFKLADAQLVIAREYGFSNWTELKQRIEANSPAGALQQAIHAGDVAETVRILREHPTLLHVPLWSGNWGPPMSHAANLGKLDVIQAIAALGARDFQHAFDRALLQGKIETARWLHAHGAQLAPGIVMGACETLNQDGLRFLADVKAPFTDEKGDRLAPVALALQTYSRRREGKHEILAIFAQQGYAFPDTPMMAFHRGDVARLREHLRRDPTLVHHRFSTAEIYPAELGCGADDLSGMHGTRIAGTTLLHLAIDFDEPEIFELALTHGADVNARATVDADGFGGHTPLFNAVISCAYICGRQRDPAMARTLLARGADRTVRVNLRKFLDWQETPAWHVARDVTPRAWGETFPIKNWVNPAVVAMLP